MDTLGLERLRAGHTRLGRGRAGARAAPPGAGRSPRADRTRCRSSPATAGTGWRVRGGGRSWASCRWACPPAGPSAASCPPRAGRPRVEPDFDHGTQRAILKLYRSADPDVLARAGERLGEVRCPALVRLGRHATPTSAPSSARRTPTPSAARPSSRWWTPATGPGSTGRAGRARARPSCGSRSASLLQPCSGPRSPLSRRRLGALRRDAAAHRPLRAPGRSRRRRRGTGAWTGGALAPVARRARVRGRLPDLAAAHRRPRRAHVPRRAVRRGGLHDLERPVVRRPPHARLQRHLAADRLAARPAGGARARRDRLAPRCSSRSPAATSARSASRWGAIWFGVATATLLFTSRLPFAHRRGVRAGRAARAAAAPLRAGDRLRRPLPARQPRRRPLPRDGRRGLRARGARRPQASGARASRSRRQRSSRPCSSPGPSPRAAGRRSRSPPTCRSRCSRSSA